MAIITVLRCSYPVAAAAVFAVTNINDSGAGSLRQAMLDANANPGLDTITFSIGTGHATIKPLTILPFLSDPVVIDGSTQPGFSGSPIIELDLSNLHEGNGLFLTGGDSTVRSLVINHAYFDGIAFGAKGRNRVEGCYIGTDVTGTIARPNGGNGISFSGSNNVVGGPTVALRNVVSGNRGIGIRISRACCTGDESPITGNVIQGNYVGVNATGSAGLSNQEGISITSYNANVPVTGNLVGGSQPGAGNVVSGSRNGGVLLDGFHVRKNTVQGNRIGTDATGSFAIANGGNGLSVTGSENLIGGPVPGARNVISGNGGGLGLSSGNGIALGSGVGNVVQGNIIGANAALTSAIPNYDHGVAGGSGSIIGGINPGEGNVIAFSGADGVRVADLSSSRNSIRGNSIFSNGFYTPLNDASIAIDLGGSGVTANDAGDADTGANNLQNFPVITGATLSANSVNLQGTLNSTASGSFTLDFYANSVCDPLGYGEGARYVGSTSVTTNSSGDASFDVSFSVPPPSGAVFTATATDSVGNTSEFSQCRATSSAVGSIDFDPTFAIVNESSGEASFVLTRTGGTAGSLTVSVSVVGVTATAGADFTATQGTFTFADGETTKMFTIPILEDSIDEPNEKATVALSTAGNLDTLGRQSTATLTINDNDPAPNISITDVSAVEGNAGTSNAFFSVQLSAPSAKQVSVNYATSNGSAAAASDYVGKTLTQLTFEPGEVTKPVAITINGDAQPEPDETFFVNLTSGSNGVISDAQGQGTILNDDGASLPLELILSESGLQLAALDSILFLRDPFPVLNGSNRLSPSADRNTRIILFVRNLQLLPGETASAVVVNLVDVSNQSYDLAAADVRAVPDFPFTQVTLRLPENLAPGLCIVVVKAHGRTSNSGTIRIGN